MWERRRLFCTFSALLSRKFLLVHIIEQQPSASGEQNTAQHHRTNFLYLLLVFLLSSFLCISRTSVKQCFVFLQKFPSTRLSGRTDPPHNESTLHWWDDGETHRSARWRSVDNRSTVTCVCEWSVCTAGHRLIKPAGSDHSAATQQRHTAQRKHINE